MPLNIKNKMDQLSKSFNDAEPGLNDASGVYIFAKEVDEKLIPIYVGQTQKDSFGGRIPHHFNQPANQKLADCWNDPFAEVKLFLIALLNGADHFENAREDTESIVRLEDLLIGSCFEVNRDLFNVTGVRFYREIRVPGYLNSRPGEEDYGDSAVSLAMMLQKNMQ